MERTVRTLLVALVVLALAIGAAACSSGDGTSEPGGNGTGGTEEPGTAEEPQEDPAVALIETKCSMCHTTDRVWSADYDRDGWVETIDRMKVQGLVVTDEEYDQILDYLANQ